LIIVPGDELEQRQLGTGVVHAIDLAESVDPGFAALLGHDPAQAPGGERVIEALVVGSSRLFRGIPASRGIEIGQITHSIICGGRSHPGIAAAADDVGKAAAVLKQIDGIAGDGRPDRIPVNGVLVNVEVGDYRAAAYAYISGRREIGLCHILQVTDQSLLRAAAGAGVTPDRPFVHHVGKLETAVGFRFVHHSCVAWTMLLPETYQSTTMQFMPRLIMSTTCRWACAGSVE